MCGALRADSTGGDRGLRCRGGTRTSKRPEPKTAAEPWPGCRRAEGRGPGLAGSGQGAGGEPGGVEEALGLRRLSSGGSPASGLVGMLPRNGLYVVAFGDSPWGCPKLGLEALVPVLRPRSCVAVTETTALPGLSLRDRWRAVSATGSCCHPRLKHLKGSQHHFRVGLAHRCEHWHQ